MTWQQLAEDSPLLHDQGSTSYQIASEVLEFIDAHISDGAKTLETGAGLTTLLFAAKGAEHICITPAQDEVTNIRNHCEQRGISLDKVTFHVGFSEQVVPYLEYPDLDLILIDGGHGFPTPFIDWYYTARALKPGGLLLVDNIELWTGDILTRFLQAEPGWKLDRIISAGARTSIFWKTEAYEFKDWCYQPFVVSNSDLTELAKAMDITIFPGAAEWLKNNPQAQINQLQARAEAQQARLDELQARLDELLSRQG